MNITNLYYRLRTSILFNYEIDYTYDELLKRLLLTGIKSYRQDPFNMYITFKDGTIMDCWNENKYYAWLRDPEIELPNGKNIRFGNCRPTVRTMFLMKKAVAKFLPPKVNHKQLVDELYYL